MTSRRLIICLAIPIAVAAIAAGCSSTKTPAAPTELYVSLGDSYAAGYQPTGPHKGATTRNGFAYQVVGLAAARGYDLKLVNFGCGGATTISLTAQRGCKQLGPGGVQYPKESQIQAALAYLEAHKGHVTLLTMSIGGNDVTSCADSPNAIECVTKAVNSIKANLAPILKSLRAAAGPKTLIIGTTYPDVILGDYLQPSATDKNLAQLSVTAFQQLINPTLALAYQQIGGTLVDVTTKTGAYIPFEQTTTLKPYGTIPKAVANVCELTFFCQYRDIHPKTAGYKLIAQLVADELPQSLGSP